jgi:isocitrate lyase
MATTHQKFVGTGYFDRVMECVSSGKSSVGALSGSTEEEQF